MFERFTDRARKVMALANQEALRLNHEYIGTEHILLGLVKEATGVGVRVLKNLGVNLRTVRIEVEKLVKGDDRQAVVPGRLPQTPRAKKAIECAIEESRRLERRYVGTEHLLLGLLQEHDGVAGLVLRNLGLELEDVRREVVNMQGAVASDPRGTADLPSAKSSEFEQRIGETLRIGEVIEVTILSIEGDKVRLSVQAPLFWDVRQKAKDDRQ